MTKTLLLTVTSFLILSFNILQPVYSQDLGGFPEEMLKKANTAANEEYLNDVEKRVYLLMNLARMDGELFLRLLADPYMKDNEEESSYTRSLRRDLKKTRGLPPLTPRKDLYDAALQHAVDMGKTGRTGHQGFSRRIAPLLKIYDVIGENCDYGNDEAMDILMNLMIDEGIEDVGHRKTILSPEYIYAGVAQAIHKKYRNSCVQIFGGKLLK